MLPFHEFCQRFGIPLFDWQREAFGAAGARQDERFVHRLGGISAPRGDGKSHGSAAFGLWRLVAGPPRCDIISTALDLDGARVMLEHATAMVRAHQALAEAIEVRANGLHLTSAGSRWTITSREHTASRGRHPDLVLYDEAGWVRDDELFASLLAGQASVEDPLMLVTSTVGRLRSGPLWRIKEFAESGDRHVFWHWHGENRSPKVTPEFLARQRRILMPAQFQREHLNQWVDSADAFTSASEIDAAMAHGWTQQTQGRRGVSYAMYVDLGAVHDPTVIAIGHREGELVFIDLLQTFQGSKHEPVRLQAVEDRIVVLAREFRLTKIRIESWQGLSAVQALQRLALPVTLFTPTNKSNSEEWPVLAQLLSTRRLVLPAHARLRDELLNLVYEVGAHGVHVIDRGRVHQDHAVAVRGVCASLMAAKPVDHDLIAWCLSAGADTGSAIRIPDLF
jgi:hypothetical protein